jgi:hypothetical protein
VAQIFNVTCPACGGTFPVHPELWDVQYDLLCPFCQRTFPQEASPLIITGTGEKRPGRLYGGGRAAASAPADAVSSSEPDPSSHAESM